MVSRRTLLALFPLVAAPALLAAAPPPGSGPGPGPRPGLSAQDLADIARIRTYLDGLTTLQAHFLQIGPQGDVTEGTAWIERPGRLRFQYAPPSPYLLVAGDGQVEFHDSQLGQTSHYPLAATPLSILLGARITLTGDVTVTRITRLPGQIHLTLVRTAHPEQGSLTLIFSEPPLELRQWVVTDAQHQQTRVSLTNTVRGGNFNPNLFRFNNPRLMGPGAVPPASGG